MLLLRSLILLVVLVSSLSGPPQDNSDSVFDGYYWYDYWVPGYINNVTWYTHQPIHTIGKAVWYGPNVMEGTARYRGLDLEGYLDGVSLMSPADIGKKVWIKVNGEWEGPFLSVDCARKGDMYGVIVHRGEVVEVGFRTAVRWGMVEENGEVNDWFKEVEVYIGERVDEDSTPISYSEYFLENLEFTRKYESRIWFVGRQLYYRSGFYINNYIVD